MKRSLICLLLLAFSLSSNFGLAQNTSSSAAKLSSVDLQKLVAPIALYPDPLLAQVLPASTYPLEIVEAARIIRGKSDFSKIDSQDWDPSVKAVAHYSDVLKMMNDKLSWTQDLGKAVINQQQDVMQAIQDLRQQAQKSGNLKTTSQQKVETVSEKIEIVPADPQVVYVPVYDPVTVYTTPAVSVVAPLITFGAGFAMGSWLSTGFYWPHNTIVYGGNYWGSHGWNNVNVNVNNVNVNNWNHNYNRDTNWNNTNNNYNNYHNNNLNSQSPFSKNSGLSTSQAQQASNEKFQQQMNAAKNREGSQQRSNQNLGGGQDRMQNRPQGGGSADRGNWDRVGGNQTMFGNNGGGDRTDRDSMRGFQSRGGGGFGGYGGGGGGGRGGGFGGGGGGFRGGGGRR